MTFPTIPGTAATNFSADQTTHAINLPSGITAGDKLILWFCLDNTTGTVTTPSGWTLLQGPINATDRSILYSRDADGTEGSTVSVTTSNSESSSAVVLLARGVTGVVSASDSSTSQFVNPPAVSGAASEECILACLVSGLGSTTISVTPNGTAGSVFASGDSGNTNGTVSAHAIWAKTCTESGATPLTIPVHLSSSVAHRRATLLLRGTAPTSGSGFPLTRLLN